MRQLSLNIDLTNPIKRNHDAKEFLDIILREMVKNETMANTADQIELVRCAKVFLAQCCSIENWLRKDDVAEKDKEVESAGFIMLAGILVEHTNLLAYSFAAGDQTTIVRERLSNPRLCRFINCHDPQERIKRKIKEESK